MTVLLVLLGLLIGHRGDPPEGIAAKAWAVADGKTGKLLAGFHEAEARPIASTTKVMTALLVLELAGKNAKVLDEEIVFSERAAQTRGSSSKLKEGERLPVRELLYGLLLPSGNDAAVALAEHFGPRLRDEDQAAEEDGVKLFVAAMNRRARELKLAETKFLDPNGLARNESSARDLVALTCVALRNERFREYVKTRTHDCMVVAADESKRTVTWKNTNRLLDTPGYDGVKTGTTSAAGACLIASGHQGTEHRIVVVLGSIDKERYEDAKKLFQWAWDEAGERKKHQSGSEAGHTNPKRERGNVNPSLALRVGVRNHNGSEPHS